MLSHTIISTRFGAFDLAVLDDVLPPMVTSVMLLYAREVAVGGGPRALGVLDGDVMLCHLSPRVGSAPIL